MAEIIVTHEQALINTPLSAQERRRYIIVFVQLMDDSYHLLASLPQNAAMSEATTDLVFDMWQISDGAYIFTPDNVLAANVDVIISSLRLMVTMRGVLLQLALVALPAGRTTTTIMNIINEWGVRMVVLLALGKQQAMPQQLQGPALAAPNVNAALQRLEGLEVARPAELEDIEDATDAAEVNVAIERLAAMCVQQMPQI